MQVNYPISIAANRAIQFPAPCATLRKKVPTAIFLPERDHGWPELLGRTAFRGQWWEMVAWLALAFGSLLALIICLDF